MMKKSKVWTSTGVVAIGALLSATGVCLIWPREDGKMSRPPAGADVASAESQAPTGNPQSDRNAGSRSSAPDGRMRSNSLSYSPRPAEAIMTKDKPHGLPGTASGAVPRQEEALKERLLSSFRSPRDSMVLKPDEKAALKELLESGVNVVDLLLAEYRKPEPAGVTVVVRNQMILEALAVLKTEDAQAALLGIALADDPQHASFPVRAAEAYIKSVDTVVQKAKLFESQDLNVKWIATKAVKGDRLDGSTVAGVSQLLLKADRVQARCDAATTLGADPGRSYTAAKVSAIVKAIASEGERQSAAKATYGTIWTERELALIFFAEALKSMTDATQAIRQGARDSQGDTKSILLAALAGRGETAVHADVVRKIRDSRDGVIRTILVNGLGAIVVADDAAFLRTLAESDDLKRVDEAGQDVYPVRDAAKGVLSKLEEP